jgi:hypothetical protein
MGGSQDMVDEVELANTKIAGPSLSDIKAHWSNGFNFDPEWDGRAHLAASLLKADEGIVCDIGCGPRQTLRGSLPSNSTYIPLDLKQWTSDVHFCDLNTGNLPSHLIQSAKVVFMLGVCEYLVDLHKSFVLLAESCRTLIVSYCSTDLDKARSPLWINSCSGPEFGSLLGRAGFQVDRSLSYKPGQYIMRASLQT